MVTSSPRSFIRLTSLLVALGLLLGLSNIGCTVDTSERDNIVVDTNVSYAFPWKGEEEQEGKLIPANATNLDVIAFDKNGKEVDTTIANNIIKYMELNKKNYRVAKIKTRSSACEFQLFFRDNAGAVVSALRFKNCNLTRDDYELLDENSQEISVKFSKDPNSKLVMNRSLLVTVNPQDIDNVSVSSSDETILSPDPNFIGSNNVYSFRILNVTETPVTITVNVNGELLASAEYTVDAAPTLYTLVANYSKVSTDILPEGSVKGATIDNEQATLDAEAMTVTLNGYEADKYFIAFDIGERDMVSTINPVKFDPDLAEDNTITVNLTDQDFGVAPVTYRLIADFTNITGDVFDKKAKAIKATIDGQRATVVNTDEIYTATIESTETDDLTVQFVVDETIHTAKHITFKKEEADQDNTIVYFLKDSDFTVTKTYTLVADFTEVTLFDKTTPGLIVTFNDLPGDIAVEDDHYLASRKNMPAVKTVITFIVDKKEYPCTMEFQDPEDPNINVLTCEINDRSFML